MLGHGDWSCAAIEIGPPHLRSALPQLECVICAAVLSSQSLLADLNANMSQLIPQLLQLRGSGVAPELVAPLWRNISAFYLNGDLPVTQLNAQGLIDLFSDRSFKYGSHQSSVLHAAAGHSTVYNYHFTYLGSKSFASVFAPNLTVNYGPCHCDDLIYLFKIFGDFSPDDPDYHVMDSFVTLWTNFAKHGYVNHQIKSPDLKGKLILHEELPQDVDKINFKRVYTDVDYSIASEFISNALDDSAPIADLQGNMKRIPYFFKCGVTLGQQPMNKDLRFDYTEDHGL
ncbi:hypothetical protein PR048_027618 [Dryococelus australis]|uniref:Carboxylesterase type B domain-containing protein n=1 Tax=Dryococelus australis TaxID=614101 RepID=A0ABQ9GH05_9NEOP|nr:hypothetical protein PR048_027618 [Dryococelus australis]